MKVVQTEYNVFDESSKGFGVDCFSLEAVNRRLLDLILRFAKDVGENDIADKLDAIRNGEDQKWHERWLEDFPWVRETFFRYFLLGERAITEAECYLLGKDFSYPQAFAAALAECTEYVKKHASIGISATQAIESLLLNLEDKVCSENYSIGSKDRDHIPLRIVQRYSTGAARKDLREKLEEVVQSYLCYCKKHSCDYAFRESVLLSLIGKESYSIYREAYTKLGELLGEYQIVADNKRIDAIPNDFERNLAIIGCADSVARHRIEQRFKAEFSAREGACCEIIKALCGNLTARETENILKKDDRLPGGMASRIVSYKLLSWLFREWVRKATYVANYNRQGNAMPVHAGGRISRTWGAIDSMPDDEHDYLDWFSGTVISKLRGWGDSRLMPKVCDKDDPDPNLDYDMVLRQWVESGSNADGTYRANIPIIRFLEGGLTFKNLKELVDNYTHNLLSKDINDGDSEFGQPLVSLNSVRDDGDGKERELIETVQDQAAVGESSQIEFRDLQLRIYEMLLSNDAKLAVYFWLVRFGTKDFVAKHIGEGVEIIGKEGMAILDQMRDVDQVPVEAALRIIGENPTNTNWFKRNMGAFIKANPGKIKALMGEEYELFNSQF